MSTPLLLKIDGSNLSDHRKLSIEDECYYFYEYQAGKYYKPGECWSESHKLIRNLKKDTSRKNGKDYAYKISAIKESGNLLNTVFKRDNEDILYQAIVCPIPPSKIKTDPQYDDRITQVGRQACEGTQLTFCELIEQLKSYETSHKQKEGERITQKDLEENYRLSVPLKHPIVILIDDVITTGTHFIACKNIIKKSYPDTRVIGFFIARRPLSLLG